MHCPRLQYYLAFIRHYSRPNPAKKNRRYAGETQTRLRQMDRPLRLSGQPLVRRAAVQTASQWRFAPSSVTGKAGIVRAFCTPSKFVLASFSTASLFFK
jgi:hypothetical protein